FLRAIKLIEQGELQSSNLAQFAELIWVCDSYQLLPLCIRELLSVINANNCYLTATQTLGNKNCFPTQLAS
ncbi:hypothetical protein EAY31_27160, partial [Vibrio anguillarum]|nr:hypothetical protein [Vibrio anguillarum]